MPQMVTEISETPVIFTLSVKLSMCLVKHYVFRCMGSGRSTPHHLAVANGRKCVVNFKTVPIRWKAQWNVQQLWTLLCRRTCTEKSRPCLKMKSRFYVCPLPITDRVLTEISWLFHIECGDEYLCRVLLRNKINLQSQTPISLSL